MLRPPRPPRRAARLLPVLLAAGLPLCAGARVRAAEEPAPLTLALAAAVLEEPDRVPPTLTVDVTSPAFERLGAPPRGIVIRKTGLLLDWDGDGRHDTTVRAGRSAVARLPRGPRVLLFERGGRWLAAPAELLRTPEPGGATAGAPRLELLDADLDGRFDGPADRVRVGERGAFFVLAAERRVASGADLWRLAWVPAPDGAGALPALRLTPEPAPAGLGPVERRGLAAVNDFRSRVGLAPLALDAAWSDGCAKHAAYILRNPVRGFGHDESPTLPGYTPEGLEAAREGVMERTGDPAVALERLTAMLLHRTPFLTDPTVGLGVGAVGAPPKGSAGPAPSGAVGPPGYSVLRAGRALGSRAQAVLVPGPGQADVPLTLLPEVPVPEPQRDLYAQPRGYAVSVSFLPGGAPPPRLVLRVADRPAPLPCRLFTPAAPLHPDFAHNYATAFLVPEEPLAPRTTYEAECRLGPPQDEQILVWRFTTRGP